MTSGTPPGPAEVELERRARQLAREASPERAGAAYHQAARHAWARGDRERCLELAERALALVTDRGPSVLRAGVELLLSELRADAGELDVAAELSVRAEHGFRAAGEPRGVLAVLSARAIRALDRGDGDRGRRLAVVLLPELDRLEMAGSAIWLRLHLALWYESCERAVDAVGWATEAMEIAAPGSGEQVVAASAALRNLLQLGEAEAAAELGAGILSHPAERAPVELRGELYLLTATALRALGQEQLAHIFAARATGLRSTGVELARRYYRQQPGPAGEPLP